LDRLVSVIRGPRRIAGIALDAAVWKPGHLKHVLAGLTHRRDSGREDGIHLRETAAWLCRAQDATADGGVCGRYRLDRAGWTSSYPETTGYLIPTFLSLARELEDESYRGRARRCVEFLLGLQLEQGAFPSAEVHQNTRRPSVFNTAQILHGLLAWHRDTQEPEIEKACRRACDWLVSVQSGDGAWRRHAYLDVSAAYHAHASCWLAESGARFEEQRYLDAAERHLDWVMSLRDAETGFIDRMGFSTQDHSNREALTHTIAYTIAGVLFSSDILGRPDALDVARQAADGVASRLELSHHLPGVLDHHWRPRARYVCLTGNAQMALIWLRLHRLEGDARWFEAALRAIDDVKAAQDLDNANPGIRGGVPGSSPPWGGYMRLALPNWAAKFWIDALLEKKSALERVAAD
jgi:uncharacterized protein YyaL (SSP411 family)